MASQSSLVKVLKRVLSARSYDMTIIYMYCIRAKVHGPSFASSDRVITNSRLHALGKACLAAFDDKRYILDDGIHTYAHGHWRINS